MTRLCMSDVNNYITIFYVLAFFIGLIFDFLQYFTVIYCYTMLISTLIYKNTY